jgi:drug/metabolite transporter (DMT)-like permease
MTLLLWWVTCLIWGSIWLFIKLGLRDLPPVTFAALRLVVAIAVFLPILAIRGVALPRAARDWRVIGVAGLLLLCSIFMITISFRRSHT